MKCLCGRHEISPGVQVIDGAGVKHGHLECVSQHAALQRRCEALIRALQKIADNADPDPWRAADTMKAIARGTLLEGL